MDKTTQLIVAVVLSVIISTLIGVSLMAAGVSETLQQTLAAPAANGEESGSEAEARTIKHLQTRLAEAETRISDLEGEGAVDRDLDDILSRLAAVERDNRSLKSERDALNDKLTALAAGMGTDGAAASAGSALTPEQLAALSSDPAMQDVVQRLAEQMRDTAANVYDEKQLQDRIDRVTEQRAGAREWIATGFGRFVEGYNERATENGGMPVDEYTSEKLNELTLQYYDRYTELTVNGMTSGWDDEQSRAAREALDAELQESLGGVLTDPTQAEELGGMVQRMASGQGRGGFGGGRTRGGTGGGAPGGGGRGN